MNSKQLNYITGQLQISGMHASKTIELLDEGATIPFIARYRKEITGSMDEMKIFELKRLLDKFKEADKRRIVILESVSEQGKLTDKLKSDIENALFPAELEELYLPYKPKRKTRASVAAELGLEPLAELIFSQKESRINVIAKKYITEKVKTVEDALAGARDIIAEWISDNTDCRAIIRRIYERTAIVSSSVVKGKEIDGNKFETYFDYSEKAGSAPSHRILAMNRGEVDGFLKLKIEIDPDEAVNLLERRLLKGMAEPKEQVSLAIKDSVKRLMLPSLEKEYFRSLKEKADKGAIEIFETNLRQLLLSPPMGQKMVLGVDPGFRTGCKVVILDRQGNLKENGVFYLHNRIEETENFLEKWIAKYKIEAIAIGNGTAGRETENLIRNFLKKKDLLKAVKVVMVSEQGASIYSASEVAREEFPDKDITVRGAVSIGRRLMDPLSELVKIDPKSIGVGQYQHDVDQKELKISLDAVVESCVNLVGVELNTASKNLLSYVSGIGPVLAGNIVDYRTQNGSFLSRSDLKKVPRLGEKAFEQAAGFLRIREAENPLDNTGVHPESYHVVSQMAKDQNASINDFIKSEELQKKVDIGKYVNADIGLPTLKDILEEIKKPGRDPRMEFENVEFADVNSIEDLKEGMVLPGIVTNITAFGCFVDIGVHQDGLVHLSNMANRYIKSPNEVVKVHQKVEVKVISVESKRGRIGLSIKDV